MLTLTIQPYGHVLLLILKFCYDIELLQSLQFVWCLCGVKLISGVAN